MLAVPQTCTEFYKRAFVICSGSVLWNSFPLEVRQLTSLNVLTKIKILDFYCEIT